MTKGNDTITVLHVDDDTAFTELAGQFLERHDDRISVRTADSASAGLDVLASDQVECVVSDYEMPGTDGLEFLDIVREEHPDLPFLLYTGKGSEEVASEAISAGVTDYLQKETGTDQYAVLANRITNAVEATRAQRERHRQLDAIESAQEGISILNEDEKFIYVNRAYADLYGYDPEEFIGNHWEMLYLKEDLPRIREEIIPAVDEHGHWHGTTTGVRADGSTFLEDHVLSRTDRGELVCTVRDDTERQEREQELLRSKRAMDEAPIGISITDPAQEDNPLIYVNSSFEELTGYSEESAVGRNCRFLQGERTDPDRVSVLREAIENRERATVELRNYRKDGSEFWNQVSIAPVYDEEGVVQNFVGFQQDVTERKERERRLEALNTSTQSLMAADSKDDVARIGVDTAKKVLGLDANAIHFVDDSKTKLEPVAVTDTAIEYVGEIPTLTPGDSIGWRAFETGEATAIDDVRSDPDVHNPDTPVRSEMLLPLGEYGILIAGSKTPAAFTDQDIVLGEILAGNIASALEQVERTERLRSNERELER
uniref:PAS domain S-box protein n=1 Tax=Salinarchaeum laminariae TaxID=869888 RepID=UPI0020C0FD7B